MAERNEVKYRKASLDDIVSLTKIRCEFLYEANGSLGEEDLTEIAAACLDYFSHAIPDESFTAWLAEDAGEIVATSGICFYEVPPNKSCPNGKVAYIQNMYTRKEHRRRGIAKILFVKMTEEAKSSGCTKILLNATDMGRPLYEKFGFTDTSGDMQLHI